MSIRDFLNKMMGQTVRRTQPTVGGMGGNATIIAKCIKYDKHKKMCTIYDPIGKEPNQRFRGDDGDISKYETLQGGRTVKVPWQPVDGTEDREDPGTALEEFHMLGVRDLDDVEPEQLYDYIEMLTAFQFVNKGVSRFLRLIVDQRKFIGGSGGGINRHWVPQVIVEVQYDMEGWPDTARATRIIETCPVPTQKPTSNSLPPGDPLPSSTTPDTMMYFDEKRFESEADWLLEALGSFQKPSQQSDSPTAIDQGSDIPTSGGGGISSSGSGDGNGFNNNIPANMIGTSNKPLITIIGPILDATQADATTGSSGNTVDTSTETAIADGIITPVIAQNVITDPSDSYTWSVSSDPSTGSPRITRYRSFGFATPKGGNKIPQGVGSSMIRLQNPIKQKHLLGISHLFKEEGPWLTIHASNKGVPIYACGDGIVRFAGYSTLFRCFTIIVEHAKQVVSVYTYCIGPSIAVRKGQYVHENQIMALLDKTEDGVVMRFGVFDTFAPVNPLNYIKGWKNIRRVTI